MPNIQLQHAQERLRKLIAESQRRKSLGLAPKLDSNGNIAGTTTVTLSGPGASPVVKPQSVKVSDRQESSSESSSGLTPALSLAQTAKSSEAKQPVASSNNSVASSSLGNEDNLTNGSLNIPPDSTTSDLISDPYQNEAVRLAISGKSFVLTGPAGSGKSTTLRRIVAAIRTSNKLDIFNNPGHKHLRHGSPAFVITSFTNRAVENDKNILGLEYRYNCLTIHKLLEYEPVWESNPNSLDGKKTMTFQPMRHVGNKLPKECRLVIMEESTLTNVPLWNNLFAALQNHTQVILVGDIQQLPPVFGKSIFIHAMQTGLPIVELKNVYRQALESPILALAHRVLSGKTIPAPQLPEWNRYSESTNSRVQIRTWPKPISELQAIVLMQSWIAKQIDAEKYDPYNDVILLPFGKAGKFGAEEINKIVAWHLAKKTNSQVWEIYTGINKKYFRIGDQVMCNKQKATIVDIKINPAYYGNPPRKPSRFIDYSGVAVKGYAAEQARESDDFLDKLNGSGTGSGNDDHTDLDYDSMETLDKMFTSLSDHTKGAESISRAASHIVEVQFDPVDEDSAPTKQYLSAAGEVADLSLGYAMTVHKAQGSEWTRVILMFHNSHAVATYRELLYTAITRARSELVIICEPNTFVKGIVSQRLPGGTIKDKLASFDKWLASQHKLGIMNESEIPMGLEGLILENGEKDRSVAQ